jgi:hypothetical protein
LAKVNCVLLAARATVVALRLISNLHSKSKQQKQAAEDVNEIVGSK